MRNRTMHMITAGVVAVALALRVWGAGWSLPYVDHPDEPAVVKGVLRVVNGHFNPQHFFYPSLILYLQALVFRLHFWWGNLSGLYPPSFTLPTSTHFYTTIPGAFVWARVCTALLGTAAVATLATWGRRFVGQREALVGAVLLAGSAWAVVHDHYITVDGPSALTGTLALLGALLVLQRGTWRCYLLAGALVGLAAGTKYQNALVSLSVALAHVLYWRGQALRQGGRLAGAALASIVVFLLTTPAIILAFDDFSHDIRTLFESYSSSAIAHGDATGAWPLAAYLRFYWYEGLQPVPAVLALLGGGVLFRRNPNTAAVLVLFPLLLVLSLLRSETHFFRNLLPTLPPLLLLAGVGVVAIRDWLARVLARSPIRPGRLRSFVPAVVVVLLLAPSTVAAIQASARLAQPDSRVVAQQYARQTWPGVRIASELSHPLQWNGVTQAEYVHYLPLHPMEWYRAQGYGLLLANDGKRGREAWTPDYQPLLRAGTHRATFGGSGSGMLGPRIDVLESGLTLDTLPSHTPQARLGDLHLYGAVVGHIEKQGSERRMIAKREIKPGRTLAVTLFWMVDVDTATPPPAPYMTFLHMRNAAGQTVVQRDAPPWQGLFPPQTWPPGQLVVERLEMWLPYEVPPGVYRLAMGLYHGETMARFPAYQGDTHLPDDEVDLGTVEVVPW
jgi:4-amino-4-deoxy-L-arabinose transferase-like glycosyltransferase